jgi:phosphatidylserine/phosphatidylglycerophosphate/cardiolipin synthase-like enzyme
MEALFTSLNGGDAIRRRIVEVIQEASALAVSKRVDLHIMTFAFTDQQIAQALADAAMQRPSLTIRILADWSQRIWERGQQVGRLAALNLPNLRVRYSKDQPYVWDEAANHPRWSYHASRGLLHHKTLGVLVEGRPSRLICGSFNWTATAARSYENLLVLTGELPELFQVMCGMELEFEAIWSDGRASLSPAEAQLHYQAIREEYRRDPRILPAAICGLARGAGDQLEALDPECHPSACQRRVIATPNSAASSVHAAIAFSFRGRDEGHSQNGCAEQNRDRYLFIRTPSGRTKRAPLTMTNLALQTIFRATMGDVLKVAMYGLSVRVPEYGALLAAARRGVRVFLLLDRIAASHVSSRLEAVVKEEGLPIEFRTAGKMMHQKYVIHAESATVLTGTANMSTDASSRHSEHRIRIGGCNGLVSRFSADFDEIWGRLSVKRSQLPMPGEKTE